MMLVSELRDKIEGLLPVGVFLYAKPKQTSVLRYFDSMEIRFTDINVEKSYFHKIYKENNFEAELLKDVEMFNERWNSPLAKVLREE